MNQDSVLRKYPLWIEIIAGAICAVLNSVLSFAAGRLGLPLFLDTVFTVTAAFFGWWSALVDLLGFCVFYEILIDNWQVSSILFSLCVLEMILVVRLYMRNKTKITGLHLVVMAAISTIIISFTGGVIATVCFSLFDYEEMKSTGFITYILLRQNVPLLIASFLSRVPINCVDKLISFFAGYGTYWIFEKIKTRSETSVSERAALKHDV